MPRMLGEAFVVISPDSDGFKTKLAAQLKKAMAGVSSNVPVTPDTGDFRAEATAKIRAALAGLNPQVPVGMDLAGTGMLRAKIEAAIAGLNPQVPVALDANAAAAAAKIEAELAALKPEIPVSLDIEGAPEAIAALKVLMRNLGLADFLDIDVAPGKIMSQLLLLKRKMAQAGIADLLEVNLNQSQLDQQLAKLSHVTEEIPVQLDIAKLPEELGVKADITSTTQEAADALLLAATKTLTSATEALNVTTAPLIPATYKLISATGDLTTATKLLTAATRAERGGTAAAAAVPGEPKVSGAAETLPPAREEVVITASAAQAEGVVETLRAELTELAGKLTDLRIGVDDTAAEAKIAALQAKVAALADKLPAMIFTANTSDLDTAIAAERTKIAALQQKMSDLQVNADTTAATAKIAALEKQIAGMYVTLEKIEDTGVDLDINAALTKIYALEAQLVILNSDARMIQLNAQTAGFNAAIAASAAKIAALQKQAASIQIGGNVSTAGLLAAQAQVLALQAATAKLTPSATQAGGAITALGAAAGAAAGGAGKGGGGGGLTAAAAAAGAAGAAAGGAAAKAGGLSAAWAKLSAVIGGASVGWTATIGGIAGWHIVLDLVIEGVILLTGTLLALGAAAAAVYPAIDQLGYGFNHALQAMTALGTDAGPVAGALDQLQKSVVPQVYEAFGGVLNLVTGQTGALSKAAHDVVNIFDTWIAKIDLWAGGQRTVNGLLASGAGYLSQLGKFFGILAQAINNLLTKDPGIVHYLLDIFQGVALLIDAFSMLPKPVVEAVLALHGLYLWGSVIGGLIGKVVVFFGDLGISVAKVVGPMLGLSTATGTMAKSFLGLSVVSWAWVAVAAVALGALAYEMTQADTGAKSFISTMDTSLSQLNASQAILQISADVGQLRTQIAQVPAQVGNMELGVVSFAAKSADAFKAINSTAPLSNQMFKDLASSIYNGVRAFMGWANIGPQVKQTQNDVSAFTGEIIKLTGQQDNLFQVTGKLVTGQNKLGIGALSVSQAFGLMDMAGVAAGDSFAVMWQKVSNLVTGYKAMSIQGGLLANSINAMDLVTEQQDSKVSDLTAAWTGFINLVTGGVSAFNTFETQMYGIAAAATAVSSTLAVSSGKASLSLTGIGTAADAAGISMTGLNQKSLQLQAAFTTGITSASALENNLTDLDSAAGLGAKGTDMLELATKDMVAQLLPLAKNSQQATTQLYALAQQGGYTGAGSFKSLSQWVTTASGSMKTAKNPAQQLDDTVTTLTKDAGSLTKDVQNLSIALGTTLTQSMSAAILQASGGQKAFDAFATAVLHTQFNSQAQVASALTLGNQLLALTGDTKDAHTEFDAFAQQMGMSRAQADLLWSEIVTKLSPTISQLGGTIIPDTQAAFESWANNSLNLSQQKADDLWTEITTKLGPSLLGLSNTTVPGAKQKFMDFATGALDLTKTAAQNLWDTLVQQKLTAVATQSDISRSAFIRLATQLGDTTTQARNLWTALRQIPSNTAVTLTETGKGTFIINGNVAPTPSGGVPLSTAVTKAATGHHQHGHHPDRR